MAKGQLTDTLIGSLDSEREALCKQHELDLEFLSCNELPHFVGYDYTKPGRAKLPVDCDYDDPMFHCEIALCQTDKRGISFRYVAARILNDEIVTWDSHGIPDGERDRLETRVMIIYRLLYPEGLRLEDMEREYGL